MATINFNTKIRIDRTKHISTIQLINTLKRSKIEKFKISLNHEVVSLNGFFISFDTLDELMTSLDNLRFEPKNKNC